jgi:hypothetical protein
MMTLEQMIEAAHQHARHVLVGSATAQIEPFFHIQFKSRPDAIIAAPWTDERHKAASLYAVRFMLKVHRHDVVNYFVLSEAWVAAQDHPPRDGDLMPSEREDKKEVVVVSAGDHEGARMKVWEIVRDDRGRVTNLVEPRKLPDHWEGRMFDLLNSEDDA